MTGQTLQRDPSASEVDERATLGDLCRELHAGPDGLDDREARRRLLTYGPNVLTRRGGVRWPTMVLAQLRQPLALLLLAAAVLAVVGGTPELAAAVVAVVVLNAAFA